MPKPLSELAHWAFPFILGFIAALLVGQWELARFTPQITLGQALQTAALLVIFLAAHRHYERAHDRRRKRIEILGDVVKGVLGGAEEAHAVFLKCADGESVSERMHLRLLGALREYSNAVSGLEDVLRRSGHLDEARGLASVKDDRADYKDLVTEAPYPSRLPQERIPHESKLHSKIRSNLVRLQLDLTELR